MEESMLFPSPNWFQVKGLAVSPDGWLIYGGPSRSICILERLTEGIFLNRSGYKTHFHKGAHCEKVVSIAISPEWPEKRNIITGSLDGSVKQWSLTKEESNVVISSELSHSVHSAEKEEITGVKFCNQTYAVTVGVYGCVVKWDLNSNVVKIYKFLKTFRPTCVSCSQHIPFHVAIGTKQGVVFVLDLNGAGKILYKVRAQDDDVLNVGWCPQYTVEVKKSLEITSKRSVSQRMDKIRNEAQAEQEMNNSGVTKVLPDDSFGETSVAEDDMFDIYADHEADEFGHKKYEPEEIIVKVKNDDDANEKHENNDYLSECLKLKEDILKKKNEPEPSIQSLVEALDNTHVSSSSTSKEVIPDVSSAVSEHIHKHLLASIGKFGAVRIWSKAGKLVGSCSANPTGPRNQKTPICATLLWYKPDLLLIADGKGQLLECNPLSVDWKNKLQWQVVHKLHKRGLYCIASNAPSIQSTDNKESYTVWTVAQDRNIIGYSLEQKRVIEQYNTCGGYIYNIRQCPYDARKLAVGVGDGAVRVLELETSPDDDSVLTNVHVTSYWQNVLGKVLTVAWHPTRENLLAFGTAETRVGLIDTSGNTEKPAKVFSPALRSGVYSLCWGEGVRLYACGGGELVLYNAQKLDQLPTSISVSVEGQKWQINCAVWNPHLRVLAAAGEGGVAVLDEEHTVICAGYFFSKVIFAVEWHPQHTSTSGEESVYKNYMAMCSLDKNCAIVIAQYVESEDGSRKLELFKTLTGHKDSPLQLAWSPHCDMQLLSTSKDTTVRIWECVSGVCTHVFPGHSGWSVSGAWSALHPALALSAGGDSTLRVWPLQEYPYESYQETKHEPKKHKKSKKKTEESSKEGNATVESADQLAALAVAEAKASKKYLLPIITKQMTSSVIRGIELMLNKYIEKNKANNNSVLKDIENGQDNKEIVTEKANETNLLDNMKSESPIEHEENSDIDKENGVNGPNENGISVQNGDIEEKANENSVLSGKSVAKDNKKAKFNHDYIKIFGTINELNEVLDMELQKHETLCNEEQMTMLRVLRGHVHDAVRLAAAGDALTPFLLSLTPGVSLKYWKDATQLYLAQMDRLTAKGEAHLLIVPKQYGGPVFRKVATLLSVHDVKAAVDTFLQAHLYKEAYILCRIRYMEDMALDVLRAWAECSTQSGTFHLSVVCHIALGELSQAASLLARTDNEHYLSLAAEIAKYLGQTQYADHIEEKRSLLQTDTKNKETESVLEELPSRIELLLRENKEVLQE